LRNRKEWRKWPLRERFSSQTVGNESWRVIRKIPQIGGGGGR